jgi:hypothetical protein
MGSGGDVGENLIPACVQPRLAGRRQGRSEPGPAGRQAFLPDLRTSQCFSDVLLTGSFFLKSLEGDERIYSAPVPHLLKSFASMEKKSRTFPMV